MTPAFAAALSDHLWQSTIVVVVVGVLTLLLRHNRAHVRYVLWLVASLKFLVPFAWLEALGQRFQRESATAAAPQGLLQAIRDRQPALHGHPVHRAHLAHGVIVAGRPTFLTLLGALWLAGCALAPVGVAPAMEQRGRDRAPGDARSHRTRSHGLETTRRGRHAPPAAPHRGFGADRRTRCLRRLATGAAVAPRPGRSDRRRAARGAAGPRAVPRAAPRQPGHGAAHAGGSRVLVPSAGVVDRAAAGGRARTGVRRGRRAVGQRSTRLRGRHPEDVRAVRGVAPGVRVGHHGLRSANAHRGHHATPSVPGAGRVATTNVVGRRRERAGPPGEPWPVRRAAAARAGATERPRRPPSRWHR